MQNMPIGIFRGDDTDAFSYQTIVGTIKTDLDLTGCRAVFRYLDFSMEFDPIPEDKKITIVIPADETKKFPPGLGYASLRVYDSEDRLKTFSNRIMVFVATKTPMFGSDEFEVDFNVRATLEPLKFFVGPNPDDFDEYRGYVKKVIDRASAEKYGLAILLDAINSDLGAADGVAATPVAVKAAYAAIIEKLTDDYYTAEQTDEAIDRVAAYYITYDAAGNPFPTRAALLSAQTMYSGGEVRTPTRNDYAIVLADETHDGSEYRYIYAVPEGQPTGSWQPQYPVEGVMTVDQDVVRGSQNPVSGGGVWSMLWGNLQFIPEGLSSVYAWVLNRLGLKRDYTDLSYDTTETVEVPALHATMKYGGQTLFDYNLFCTEDIPDPPAYNHLYTWRTDGGVSPGAEVYVTQMVSALTTTWTLYSQTSEVLDTVQTSNSGGLYPDFIFSTASGMDVDIHKTTAQKTVTVEDELALKSEVPAPSTATPAMDGAGSAGSSAAFARGDHVHPSDTSRVPTSRKVNGKALSSDVTLDADDIGALPAEHDGSYYDLTDVGIDDLNLPSGTHVNGETPILSGDVVAPDSSATSGKVADAEATYQVLADKQNALSAQQLANIAAVPNKADASAIPYSLGTPTVIDTASSEVVEGETVYYGAATLADRTANIVQVTAATPLDELRITFPAATSGKVRDFGLRVEIGTGSAALAAPALVPIAPTGETIKIENADRAIPELADGTATAKGVTLLYFSENAPGVFVVKGEQVEEVA